MDIVNECRTSVGLVRGCGRERNGSFQVDRLQFLVSRAVTTVKEGDQDKKANISHVTVLLTSLMCISFYSISSFTFHFRVKIRVVSISNYALWNHILSVSLKLFFERPGKDLVFVIQSSLIFQWRINR